MKKWFKQVLLGMALVVGFLVVGLGSPAKAQAEALPHFASRTITYRITTKSKAYKNAWTNALKQWGKLGVVKFVPATGTAKPDFQLGAANLSDNRSDHYDTTQSIVENSEDDIVVRYKLSLNRRGKKSGIKRTAMGAIGITLGLETPSKKANSALKPGKKAPSKPTKLDKKNLQKVYKGVPY
ncbi:hypothetical protein [Levilactobacillus enshiensis]|uniref:hypothetical protein n=1 Tax=Levilactobacillus enshiensis TaxID=2590213 RepID=UPI00117B7DF9|nr:hypothetical protein [Levilactobacillus enshiensis]